jgi:3',5'-cyclic AMP phosphodiesterase CpdA
VALLVWKHRYHWEEPAAINTTVGIANLVAAQPSGHVDVILHPGDLAYATGYESEWDRFMEQISPLAARAPYMTGQGNHERSIYFYNLIFTIHYSLFTIYYLLFTIYYLLFTIYYLLFTI